MNLKAQAVSGVKWTTLSSVVNAVLQLAQLMILARYLEQTDFGIIAILMVVIGFSQIFVDFGLSKAIIYHQNVTHRQLSTLYWLNILLGFFIFSVIYVSSDFIADFYNEPLLSGYIILISTAVVLQAFGQQFRVLFQKELKFMIISKIDIVAAIVSFVAAVTFVLNGFGVLSLIYPVIIMAFIKTILLVYFGLEEHKPQFVFKINEVRSFISFGGYTVGNGMVSTIATQIDVILIGKLLGTETLGLYSVLKELLLRPAQIINPIITKVAFPTMSKVNNDIARVKKIYLKLINYISSINFPIYIATMILAPEVIVIFLGEKWLEGVFVFQILALWAMVRSIGNPIGSLVMAMGKPQYEMYWNLGLAILMPFVVYISSLWGIRGIAIGNVMAKMVLYIPSWYFLVYKLSGATLKEYFSSSLIALAISFITGLFVYFLIKFIPDTLFIKVSISLIVGVSLIYILNKFYNKDFFNIMLSLVGRHGR